MTDTDTPGTAAHDVEGAMESLGDWIALNGTVDAIDKWNRLASLIRQLRDERDRLTATLHKRTAGRDAWHDLCRAAHRRERAAEARANATEAKLAALTGPEGDMRDYHDGIVGSLMAEVSRLSARVEALEKALEPFAREADDWPTGDDDERLYFAIESPDGYERREMAYFRLGDLRTARAVKEATDGE